jgi:hypothetical protein
MEKIIKSMQLIHNVALENSYKEKIIWEKKRLGMNNKFVLKTL